MKYYRQVKNGSVVPNITYKFVSNVDTKGGVALYTIDSPPLEGYKFDTVTKSFVKLSAADLTKYWTEFDTDQKKLFYLQKWKVITGWAVAESPKDDGFPPWPGVLSV